MKEIYLLNMGDTIEKAKQELGLVGHYALSEDKVLGSNYIELNSGGDDITIVKNYLPSYIYKVRNNENIMDILSRGFVVNGVDSVSAGDLLILTKPKSIRYIVGPLETLNSIAKKFGVDKDVIMVTNNLMTEKLFVGQILWI